MFKKIFAVILVLILTFGICAVGAAAVDIEEPVYNFYFKSGDTVNLSSFYSEIRPYQQLGIPVHMSIVLDADTYEPISGGLMTEYYEGKYIVGFRVRNAESITFSGTGPVLAAYYKAFSGNSISELYLPDNVYSFDYGYDTENYEAALEKARRTGEPLQSGYGEYMFSDCQKLETVTIDNPSDKMLMWAFYNCTSLKNVVFSNKVSTICKGMFDKCTSLENIEFSPTVNKICDCAFFNSGLKSIYIPSTVKTIEPYAVGYSGNDNNASGYETSALLIERYPEKYEVTKVEGFKIYGGPGSEAQRYAEANGFEFIEAAGQAEENKVYSASVTKQAAIGNNAEIAVTVSTGADKIQFINSENKTFTYTRDSANVKSISAVSNAKETWMINLKTYKPTENYRVIAKFGRTWVTDDNVQFVLNELLLFKKKVFSAKVDIPGLIGKYARVNVTVGGSPSKIQFRNSSGSTITYTRNNVNVVKIESDSAYHTETWKVKLKVYRPTEDYIAAAKYNTGWSDETASFNLKELVKSSSDFTFRVTSHSQDYDYDDRLDIYTGSGTKRIVSGNVYEGDIGGILTRESIESSATGSLYDPAIGSSGNGREHWDLPNGTIYSLLNLSGELKYLSAEMADGSWVVKGYYGGKTYNGYRYEPYVLMAETDPVTEPVKKVNSAEVVSQSGVGGTVDVKVNVDKDASKICFVNSRGGTFTYTPDSASVKSIEPSGDYDVWTIQLYVYRPTDTYTVNAKYGREWKTDSGVQFTVTAQ